MLAVQVRRDGGFPPSSPLSPGGDCRYTCDAGIAPHLYAHIVLATCNLAGCAAAVLAFSASPCTLLAHMSTIAVLLTAHNEDAVAWVFSSMQCLAFACLQREVSQTYHHTYCDFRASACLVTGRPILCRHLIVCSPKAVCSSGPEINNSGVAEGPLCMYERTPTAMVLPAGCALLQCAAFSRPQGALRGPTGHSPHCHQEA